ncbi:MAG: glucose-1-phosphate thymidylyltransferase, partial [Bacteroidetes bacterium]
MNYILFDDSIVRTNLLPLTFMRPIADIRVGILTIREKWETHLNARTSTLTESYLSKKYRIIKEDENILINASVCPTPEIVEAVLNLRPYQTVVFQDTIIAVHVKAEDLDKLGDASSDGIEEISIKNPPVRIGHTWEVFSKNGIAINEDFNLLTGSRKSQKLSSTNTVIGGGKVFLEKGAKVECATLNTQAGPIYIGK